MDIIEALEIYGLSKKEAQVYFELLPLGSINLQEVAKRIDLPRTTIYNTLNYLITKGLVSQINKKGIRFYEATDPEKFIQKIKEKEILMKSILPEMKALKEKIKKSSSANIFQGKKGLFTLLTDVFEKDQQTYYFGSYTLSKEILKHFPEHFRNKRMENKIKAKIVIDNYEEEIFKTKEYKKLTKIRFNKTLKEFPCMIFIYGQKVALYTLKNDLIGIIIDNQEVADAMKMIFDIYWSQSSSKV